MVRNWQQKENPQRRDSLRRGVFTFLTLTNKNMCNLLLKLAGTINPNVNRNILLAKKHRLQEELHEASVERNLTRAEQIGDELLEVNKALNKHKC